MDMFLSVEYDLCLSKDDDIPQSTPVISIIIHDEGYLWVLGYVAKLFQLPGVNSLGLVFNDGVYTTAAHGKAYAHYMRLPTVILGCNVTGRCCRK